jgi:hypothetical protein
MVFQSSSVILCNKEENLTGFDAMVSGVAMEYLSPMTENAFV